MDNFFTPAGFVACEPFGTVVSKRAGGRGLALEVQKTELVGLKVIAHNRSSQTITRTKTLEVFSEDYVYLRDSRATQPWAKEVFNLGFGNFILAPIDEVCMVKHRPAEPPTRPEPTSVPSDGQPYITSP